MELVNDPQYMQKIALAARAEGRRIAFVPTMGYLHEGHLSLLREGRRRGDLLVLSIFVNPTQFGQGEDFDSYPRDLSRDVKMARSAGTDIVFAPEARDMYPRGYSSYVDVEGITDCLCGASRPGHFRGVTTVVTKLFTIVQPHVALFGQKDFQQLAVIQRMAQDLNLPVEVVGMPIVREPDGLAMSSRNVYLSEDQRRQALALPKGIEMARQMAQEGERNAKKIVETLRSVIEQEKEARVDYLQIRHQTTLQEQETLDADSVLLMAVFVGKTRLLDNGFLL